MVLMSYSRFESIESARRRLDPAAATATRRALAEGAAQAARLSAGRAARAAKTPGLLVR